MISLTWSLRLGAFMVAATVASVLPFTVRAHELLEADTPAAADAVNGSTAIACPLDGPSEFVDSWGARRSGGRSHEGVDMAAERGTPVLAVQSGSAEFKRNRLGGNAVWITTADGNEFYYAHLDGFAGSSRTVETGEVIGYVGSTGNAKGPHLHFETHFGGSVGNPYPATFGACVQPIIDALDALDTERNSNAEEALDTERNSNALRTMGRALT